MVEIDLNQSSVKPGTTIEYPFWEELDRNCSVPSHPCAERFYIPRRVGKRGWVERIQENYEIKPWFVFDSEVGNLLYEVQKNVAEPVKWLKTKQVELQCELAQFEKWTKPRKNFQDLTNFEKKLLKWGEDYGLLWDHRFGAGQLFSMAREKDMQYEIDREFLFHTSYEGLVLSLSREINSERPVYGFRKQPFLEWPFDISEEGLKFPPEKVNPLVKNVNFFINHLEKIISE